jgi:hypothetical protein
VRRTAVPPLSFTQLPQLSFTSPHPYLFFSFTLKVKKKTPKDSFLYELPTRPRCTYLTPYMEKKNKLRKRKKEKET